MLWQTFFLFIAVAFTLQLNIVRGFTFSDLLEKPWSQVSSLLPVKLHKYIRLELSKRSRLPMRRMGYSAARVCSRYRTAIPTNERMRYRPSLLTILPRERVNSRLDSARL